MEKHQARILVDGEKNQSQLFLGAATLLMNLEKVSAWNEPRKAVGYLTILHDFQF